MWACMWLSMQFNVILWRNEYLCNSIVNAMFCWLKMSFLPLAITFQLNILCNNKWTIYHVCKNFPWILNNVLNSRISLNHLMIINMGRNQSLLDTYADHLLRLYMLEELSLPTLYCVHIRFNNVSDSFPFHSIGWC